MTPYPRIPRFASVIAATNRDLKRAIASAAFREDLYYRLNVLALEMPPLRERREDIPLLASHFAAALSAKCGRHLDGISMEARKCFSAYDWPGNVRELENAIERAVALGSSNPILREDLPDSVRDGVPAAALIPRYHAAIKQAKRNLIENALEQAGRNCAGAAEMLGLNATYLYRLIRNLGVKTR